MFRRRSLRPQLSSLQTENSSLRWPGPGFGSHQHRQEPPPPPPARGGRPMSMYETGSASRPYPAHRGEALRHGGLVLQPLPPNVSTHTHTHTHTPTHTHLRREPPPPTHTPSLPAPPFCVVFSSRPSLLKGVLGRWTFPLVMSLDGGHVAILPPGGLNRGTFLKS